MKKTIKRTRKAKKNPTILESVYSAAQDLHEIGLMDTVTMRKFAELCKKPVHKLSPTKIKEIRLREKVSQPVFAWYLNVKPTTVKKWEIGENIPSGPALRLLNVIEQHGLSHICQ